ncbi:MAG: DUF3307 domain-containing protein [Anaerolineales bacterium]|nr:DUF3307 domain-containing protein [Anaerolineales bacterium]
MMHRFLYLFLPLFTAHILADFLLQTDLDVRWKTRPRVLLKHVLIVGVLSYLLLGVPRAWPLILVLALSHAIFDFIKTRYAQDRLLFFVIDQAAHLTVIIATVLVLDSMDLQMHAYALGNLLGRPFFVLCALISGIIISVKVGGITVGYAVRPLLEELEEQAEEARGENVISPLERGFEEGGRIIGYLERALILLFILVNQPAGVGFLIAAKSIFRFGELSDSSRRMEAEYIIIGTLYSFLFGLISAYGLRWLLTIL